MSTMWVAILALAASPGDTATPSSADSTSAPAAQSASSLRTGTTLREAAHEALRRWAKPSDKEADQAAREFLVLYQELVRDGQILKAQRESLRLKVRGRLIALSQQISKRVAIENRLAKKDGKSAGPKPAEILAQWGGGMGGGMGGPGMGGGMGPGMGPGMGGGMMGSMGGGGFGPLLGDSGQELVDLIQAVIAPQTWDVNGGPGSIKYWRPGLSIVVRASDEVHGQIGGLVDQLQRAGN
jgi:hypothetical protein